MTPLGVVIIGCGGIGRWHARQVRALPGLELVAMVDPDPSARARASHDFNILVSAEPAEVLAAETVTLVSICTPPSTHAELAITASAAGKHVLVEKPMALDLASADRMLSSANAAGMLLGIVHQQRTQPAARALHRLLRGRKAWPPAADCCKPCLVSSSQSAKLDLAKHG